MWKQAQPYWCQFLDKLKQTCNFTLKNGVNVESIIILSIDAYVENANVLTILVEAYISSTVLEPFLFFLN